MNECIICLCAVDLDDEEANFGSHLTQDIPCKCIYSVHEICLSKWLKTKFSCPMCGTIPIGIVAHSDESIVSDPREHLLSPNQIPRATRTSSSVCTTCCSSAIIVFLLWLIVKGSGA